MSLGLIVLGLGLGVVDEESAGPFADPLGDALVVGDAQQLFDAVERVVGSAARALLRRFRPLVNE